MDFRKHLRSVCKAEAISACPAKHPTTTKMERRSVPHPLHTRTAAALVAFDLWVWVVMFCY